jgi:hypothetical protein
MYVFSQLGNTDINLNKQIFPSQFLGTAGYACHVAPSPSEQFWLTIEKRNGSAFDSRSKGYPFKSGVVQYRHTYRNEIFFVALLWFKGRTVEFLFFLIFFSEVLTHL